MEKKLHATKVEIVAPTKTHIFNFKPKTICEVALPPTKTHIFEFKPKTTYEVTSPTKGFAFNFKPATSVTIE